MKRTPLTALAVTAALALTGCGGNQAEEDTQTTTAPATPQATVTVTDTATATPTETGTGAATGTATASPTETGTGTATGTAEAITAEHNDADVMFAQIMIPHHQRAVQMSEMLRAKQDIPAEVTDFAQKVIDTQGPEIERLNAMLDTWGEEPMGTDDGGTNEMTPEEDMAALEQAQGTEAARLYLDQMTAHHEGAIEMAQAEVDNGQNPQAVEMAQQVVTDQQAEITEMQQLTQELPAS